MDCHSHWNRKNYETRQDDWVFHFGSTIRLYQTFSSSLAVCAKKQFYLQNERKQTPAGLRLLTFTQCKNTRTALEFMEYGENKTNAVSSLCFNLIYNLNLNFIFYLLQVNTFMINSL
jgi:hypothetical protein